jgi:pimeloyl-ACP methyl ester carboxylesterase
MRRTCIALIAACAALIALPAAAGATAYAPLDQPGPALSVPNAELASALHCSAGVANAQRPPILLTPGTTLTPDEFRWNWEVALSRQGWPFCTITLPHNGMSDIQVAGEYMVYAIRTMHALAGRQIDIVGHSQGGMVGRWALRFWPDTRAMVDDVVGLSPSNHGTIDANALCAVACAPSIWQQRDNAAFLGALNSDAETFPGISYTSIYTNTDEVVVPNFGGAASSPLHTGGGQITNVALQQVCPLDLLSEHLAIGTYDNVSYALAMDALTHPGPADPARVGSAPCASLLMPGVDPLTFPLNYANYLAEVATGLISYPVTTAEPALDCYVTASCAASGDPVTRSRSGRRRRHRVRP